MEYIGRDILAKACTDFYKHQVIQHSKKLLYSIVNPDERCIQRRSTNKARDDFNDIYRLLHIYESQIGVQFVAKDLSNLPSLSMSNMDIGKLAKEIETLKQNICTLTQGQKDLHDVFMVSCNTNRKNVDTQTDDTQTANEVNIVNTGDDALRPTVESQVQADRCNTNSKNAASANDSDSVIVMSDDDTLYTTVDEVSGEDIESYADVAAKDVASSITRYTADKRSQHCVGSRLTNKSTNNNVLRPSSLQATSGDHSVSKYNSRHAATSRYDSNGIVHGTGVGSNSIKAVNHNLKRSHEPKNVIGVFVTRFVPRTSSRQIEEHIKSHTGLDVWIQKLQTKHDSYCSFYLKALDKRIIDTLMDRELWPKGILVKRYTQ